MILQVAREIEVPIETDDDNNDNDDEQQQPVVVSDEPGVSGEQQKEFHTVNTTTIAPHVEETSGQLQTPQVEVAPPPPPFEEEITINTDVTGL